MAILLNIRGPLRALMVLAIITPLTVIGPARAAAPSAPLVGPVTNGMIATFAWPPGAHISDALDLVVMKSDGSGAQVLVPGAARRSLCGFDLDWSPDGNRIAWASESEVWTIEADGTDRVQIAVGCVSHLEWSPDGTTLVMEIEGRTGLFTLAGGAFRWLRGCEYGEGSASFSPDGSALATVATADCDSDPIGWGVYGFQAADGTLDARYADTNLRSQPPNNYLDAIPNSSEWHPSQDLILVSMDDGSEGGTCHPLGQTGGWGNSDLFTVPASTDSPLTKVGSTSGEFELWEREASWSPDGTRILFTGDRNLSCQNGSYVHSGVDLYTMNANGSSTTKIWTPWSVELGFVASSWQPCTATSMTCVPVPPPDTDGDGVPNNADLCPTLEGPASNNGCPVGPPLPDSDGDAVTDNVDACPTVPGPPSNQGCPVPPPPPDADQCDGLDRGDVLGDYLPGKNLSSFPNSDTMCAGLMLEGAEKGFIPQGLALAGGGQAWVTGYVPGENCWVLRVDLHSGNLVKRQVGIDAKGVVPCSHAGGAALTKDGLWVADTNRLWLLDPKQVGKTNAVLDHWTLYQGTDKPRRLKGSFLLDSEGRLGIGQFGKQAGKIQMFRFSDLRKKSVHTLIGQGTPRAGEAAPTGSIEARKKAQGAEFGPNGGLVVAASTSTCGLLERAGAGGTREFGFGPGVEEFEFAGATRLWAVFEASAEKYHKKSGLVVPMLAQFDATRLFAPGAESGSC